MLLSVIIVSYNTKDLTIQTITSVAQSIKNSKLLSNQLEIIVVDNDSKDGSQAAITALAKKISTPVLLIKNTENLGFGVANNIGSTKARGKYYLFLNSDTIVSKNTIENMVKRFIENAKETDTTKKKLGILAPALLNIDHSYQPQGGSFPTLSALFFQMSMLDDLPIVGRFFPSTQHTGKANQLTLEILDHYTDLIPFDWVGGTAMMVSKEAIDTFGPFDQNIFMYAEDVEICLRANNHHYQVALDPTARIIHLQNASSSSKHAITGEYAGYLYIFSKHHSTFATALARVILQYGALLRIFLFSTIAVNKQKAEIYKAVLHDLS